MMPNVFSLLYASSACRQFLGEAPMRVYRFGEATQGTARPYATVQMPTQVPENYITQEPDADTSRIQIDVYAETEQSADETALAIRDAIAPHAQMQLASSRPRDPVTRSFGYVLDFSLQLSR